MIIVTVTNNKGKLSGKIPQSLLEKISEHCSFKIKGAEHSPLYKRHQWDGYKRLFNRQTKSFPIGLYNRVIGILDDSGLQYSVRDERVSPSLSTHDVAISGLLTRPYQEEAKKRALEAHRGIIQVATGGGKTIIASMIMAELKCQTLFMVHTKDLLYQAKNSFEEVLGIEIGQIGDGVVDIKPITVATMQTISKALGKKYKDTDEDVSRETDTKLDNNRTEQILKCIKDCQLVIWDEVHRIACDMAMGVSEAITNAYYRIGLSASPWRDDGADLMIEASIGHVIYKVSASDLIDQGYLVPPIIKMEKIKPVQLYGTYDQLYKANIVENEARNNRIVEHVEYLMEQNIPTLILVKHIKHGEILKRLIREKFGPVEFLSGRDYTEKRNQTIEEMRIGQRHLLIASTIADEGLDIKRLGAVILAGSGKSSTRALQRVGRAIRPFEGKDHAIIIDFIDECQYLREHAQKRKEIYKQEEKFIILEL